MSFKGKRRTKPTPNRDPLRKIVCLVEVPFRSKAEGQIFFSNRELLECGHDVAIRQDFVGRTNATSRRCYHCAAGDPAEWQLTPGGWEHIKGFDNV